MIAKVFKCWFSLFFIIVAGGCCTSVYAETNCNIPTPVLNMPLSITVSDDAPVPSLLGGWQYVTMDINCWKNTYYEWDVYHRLYSILPSSSVTVNDGGVNYNVFQTGQPGVGIAIGFQNYDTGSWESLTTAPINTTQSANSNQIRKIIMLSDTTGGNYNTAAKFKVVFVKTATVRNSFNTGALTIVNYYPVWYGRTTASGPLMYDTKNLQYSNIQISAVQFNVTPPSCSVSIGTQNQTVELMQARKAEFTGLGSTVKPKDFSIDLINCKKLPLVTMTLGGTADGDLSGAASKGVLKVTSDTASGVGVQIVNGQTGAAFPLNSPSYMGAVTGSGVGDVFTIPLKAQYIQTKSVIVGGRISAMATVTLSYQ